ncbi:MAG: hypothetical protein CL963_03520 [Euryarchaeota archaeon]|jgi:small subunit ribosomal protein S28e|nr:hypothetical protein [Euryarchaeota archaeon]MAF89547.1 hypothetical protein [Euryarchaeota archaeon]HIK01355.1 hypothetical protein [Candidatus Undinarchaeales archaeon ERR594346 U_76725]|tara:strand:- start:15861 stop:16241 length:381 start_codon:yes stop_codon:yes gene_type:complete
MAKKEAEPEKKELTEESKDSKEDSKDSEAPKEVSKKPSKEKSKKTSKKESKQEGAPLAAESSIPARVTEIMRRTGATGGIIQVRAEVLDGRDKGRVVKRNVKGPIREGDILLLKRGLMDVGDIKRV